MLLMKGSVFNSNAVPHLCACALLIEQCAEASFAALRAWWLAAVHALTPACLPALHEQQHSTCIWGSFAAPCSEE